MPQTALNYTQTQQEQENSCKIIQLPKQKFYFAQMESSEETAVFDQMTDKTDNKTHKGMDFFPIDVYNQMIEYSLNCGKIRNAMLLICTANWGMRFSDAVRVRFGYIIDKNGYIKDSFSLPNGEQKTKKTVLYYNNKATEAIISLYLQTPEGRKKSRLDYLFVSESKSGNKPLATVQELEANDLYDVQIKEITKKIKESVAKMDGLEDKYLLNKYTDDEYAQKKKKYQQEEQLYKNQLNSLVEKKKTYISPTPNAENIYLQKPLRHTAGENIIKDTLQEIGIVPKNRKDKSIEPTVDAKYNTHSLRKTFTKWFIDVGEELKNDKSLHFDATVLDLLKEKLKHSSLQVTAHYTDTQERAFKLICQHLNIGLETVENYLYK